MYFKRLLLLFLKIVGAPRIFGLSVDNQILNPESNFLSKSERWNSKGWDPNESYPNSIVMDDKEFPWAVQIYYEQLASDRTKQWIFICTGAIISPQVIITAAHCVTDANNKYAIMAGEKLCQKEKTSKPFVWIEMGKSAIRVHPLYKGLHSYDYNVALMKLTGKLKFSNKINKIEICHRDVEYWSQIQLRMNKPSLKGTVVGWGWHSKGTESCVDSHQLQIIDQDIMLLDECRAELMESGVNEEQLPICLSFCGLELGGRKYKCKSDTGVPFVVNGTLFGISTKFYSDCEKTDSSNHIVVYTRLSDLGILNWLKDELKM